MDTEISGEISIRSATAADLPALCRLLAALFAQEAEFRPDAARQRAGLEAILADPEAGRILVADAEAGDGPVGMAALLYTVSTALGGRVALLEDMVVAPRARGAGVGGALVEAALRRARADGALRVTLLTDGDNAAAQRFYRRHGFVRSTMVPFRHVFD